MKLYLLPGAPNPTKVALYVAEKENLGVNLGLETTVLNPFKGEQNTPEHLARNPFGALPTLETDTGQFVFESLAIIEYLEEKFPTPSLWGDTPEARAIARNIERVADVRTLNPSAGYVHVVNSPLGIEPNEVIANYLQPSFRRGLGYLDSLLADGRPLLAGEQVTVGDCTLQGALQFMRFRELEDLTDYPHVASWSERYRSRPAVQDVLIF